MYCCVSNVKYSNYCVMAACLFVTMDAVIVQIDLALQTHGISILVTTSYIITYLSP